MAAQPRQGKRSIVVVPSAMAQGLGWMPWIAVQYWQPASQTRRWVRAASGAKLPLRRANNRAESPLLRALGMHFLQQGLRNL